jgi:N-acetylglucosamine-6-sulfatase
MRGPPSPSGDVERRRRRSLALLIAAELVMFLSLAPPAGAQEPSSDRPSVLLIVTDDQRWDTMWAMPEVQRSLVAPGVTFANAFTTSSLCCPSRASILTGAYPHTTGVYTQGLPHGGFEAFDDSATIATELRRTGYRTGFFGKYLDSYQSDALAGYVPPGWDRWVAFVHSQYFDYGLTVDGTIEDHGFAPDDYSTDVLAEEADAFIRSSNGPILAVFAPAAPHEPAIPAAADEGLFADLPAWGPPAFDEADLSDKPPYVRNFRRLGTQRAVELEQLRRNQYRSLQAVDRSVARLLDALDDTGRLDDALVIFTSDNGLLWGEHRWLKKEVPYEEAIRVPLVVRADAIATASSDEHLVANIDLAPTIADAADVAMPNADGASLVPLLRGETPPWRSALLIEHVRGTNPIPTYCAVRTARQLFVVYETGERELYDLASDPAELENLAGTRPVLQARLETTLHGLCDPPPPGFTNGGGPMVVVLALATTLAMAGVARTGLRRTARR